ncbi:hypothetical protein [Mycolicibacterium vaccae]|uniref:hypothetical protein n=1 Tax=Mycolicibacterium vaccae TaxID=1810 RepID=UPI003CFE8A07
MTVEMLDRTPPPGLRFLRAWLLPLGGAGASRDPKVDQLPFTLLQRYDGHEDLHTDHGYYQLDHLHTAVDGKTSYIACEDYANDCKRRLLYLRDHSWTEVDVPAWGPATADRVRCIESPHEEPYPDPAVTRMVSRFYIALRLVPAP